MQHHIGTAREGTLGLAVLHPEPVSGCEALEPLRDCRPPEPFLHRVGANPQEQTLAAVFDRREPLRFKRNLSPLNIRLVLAVDVRRDSFKPCEAYERQDFTQPM